MSRNIPIRVVEAALAILLALSLGPLDAAAAEEAKTAKAQASEAAPEAAPKRSWRRAKRQPEAKVMGRKLDDRTAKRLAQALEYLQEGKTDLAEQELNRLRMRSLNAFERAQTFRIYAFVEFGKGDTDAARERLQAALDENALPPGEQASVLFQIVQLYLGEQKWPEVISHLNQWFEIEPDPNAAAYYILALSYYQLGDLDAALEPAQKAIDLAKQPQESWLRMLLALRLTRKEYAESIPLLESLIRLYPQKIYWVQLSTVHGVLEDYEEALVPLQLAYQQNLLSEDAEFRRLAQLLLFLNLPYRASEVLQRGLEEDILENDAGAHELLGNSHIAAREYEQAVGPLLRAAELSDDGEIYYRLAQVHLQREKWADATSALREAMKKGGLENQGAAQLLMGIAYYSQKKPERAKTWFTRAKKSPDTREDATNWLNYLQREQTSS